jgi:hypothetical protein
MAKTVDGGGPLEIQAGLFDPAGEVLPNGADLHPSAVSRKDLDAGAIDSPTEDLRISPWRVFDWQIDFGDDRRVWFRRADLASAVDLSAVAVFCLAMIFCFSPAACIVWRGAADV